eukprot:1137747_1
MLATYWHTISLNFYWAGNRIEYKCLSARIPWCIVTLTTINHPVPTKIHYYDGLSPSNVHKRNPLTQSLPPPQTMPLMRFHEYQQPNQQRNTFYGLFFIRSAPKNKIEMRVDQICGSIPYGVHWDCGWR